MQEETQIESHKTKIRQKKQWVSLLSQKTGHEFQYDKKKILAEQTNYWRRLIREGIEIRRDTNTANLKAGFEIDRC